MKNWQEHITTESTILLGKPVIRGTRISVEFILQRFASGWTLEELLENYPRLTIEDIKAVFSYTYECMKDGLLYMNPKRA